MNEYNFCLRCNRRLKNPTARMLGYGSICFRKTQHSIQSPLFQVEGREQNGKARNEAGNRTDARIENDI